MPPLSHPLPGSQAPTRFSVAVWSPHVQRVWAKSTNPSTSPCFTASRGLWIKARLPNMAFKTLHNLATV